MNRCNTCKHWRQLTEWNPDSDRVDPLVHGECLAIESGLRVPWHYKPEREQEALKRQTLAYINYEVATLLVQRDFGCVLHEEGEQTSRER